MARGGSVSTGGAGGRGGNGGAVGTGGMGRGGVTGTGGSGTGGSGTGGSGPGTPSKEDQGADCTVGTLPAANTAIAKLPDPFKKIDGTMVTSKADWRCRREEIKKLEEKYVYGPKPPPPMSVTGTVSTSSISVTVMDGGKSASFTASVSIPSGATQPVPAIISYGGLSGLDMAWLNSEGIAFINFNPTSVGAEGHGHGTNQTGAFYTLYSGGSATGLLTAWGWGVSRIIDLIEKSGSTIINPAAIGVTGCSRYGKGAFIAGVLDQRIALTMPVESGTAGVPIWRGIAKAEKGENGNPSQSLSSAYSEQPWFGDPFQPFLSNPANNPIDTHELVAMIAPRGPVHHGQPPHRRAEPEVRPRRRAGGRRGVQGARRGRRHQLRLERRERHALLGAAGVADAVQERRRAVPQEDRYGGGRHQRELGPVGQPGRLARLDDADAAVVAVARGQRSPSPRLKVPAPAFPSLRA